MENVEIKGWKEIEYSEKAKQVIKALKTGQCLAVRMKHVNSSRDELPKVQIEFAEKILGANNVVTAGSFLNSKDDRYSSGARRTWETADLEVAVSQFGVIPDGESSVEILKVVPLINGMEPHIQVTEDIEANMTEDEMEYPENYLKRAGAEGNYFYTPQGHRVISRTRLIFTPVGGEVPHTFLQATALPEGVAPGGVIPGAKPAVSKEVLGAG